MARWRRSRNTTPAKKLGRVSDRWEGSPRTNWTINKEKRMGNKPIPGSPCYHSRQIDKTMHRRMPLFLNALGRHNSAKKWATTSPRWGVSKKVGRENRIMSAPWAAGKVSVEGEGKGPYLVKRRKKIIGAATVGKRKININLDEKRKGMGYTQEINYLFKQKGFKQANLNTSDFTKPGKQQFYYRTLKGGQRQRVKMPNRSKRRKAVKAYRNHKQGTRTVNPTPTKTKGRVRRK